MIDKTTLKLNALLRKYKGKTIEDYGGITSPQYKEFENDYYLFLKAMCKAHNWQLKMNKNHYEFSVVIKRDDGQFVYVSICDVRYFKDEWNKRVLYRTMKHEKDWSGGSNHYASINELEKGIESIY